MKWFRDVNTGKVAKYPARFGERFTTLVPVHEDEAACRDCMVQSAPAPEPDGDNDPEVTHDDETWDDETEEDEDRP